jgi:hypothetical protein
MSYIKIFFLNSDVEHGKLNIDGQIVQIKHYLNDLARKDKRWYMPGKLQQGYHLFRPIFDGHVMVPLVNNDGVETARCELGSLALSRMNKAGGAG